MPEETYLGDGLYCAVDRAMIKLRAPQWHGADHIIYLDPEVYAALKEFARKIGWEPDT